MRNIFKKFFEKLLTFFCKECIIKINKKGGRTMNIIEREIARREGLIDNCSAKVKEIEEYTAKIEILKREVADFDEVAVRAEIAELETYLPQNEPYVEPIAETPVEAVAVVEPTTEETIQTDESY